MPRCQVSSCPKVPKRSLSGRQTLQWDSSPPRKADETQWLGAPDEVIVVLVRLQKKQN